MIKEPYNLGRARRYSNLMAPYYLTQAEHDVLRLICQGMGNKVIARRLHIGRSTVSKHATRLYVKLGVRDRTQAAIKFYLYYEGKVHA